MLLRKTMHEEKTEWNQGCRKYKRDNKHRKSDPFVGDQVPEKVMPKTGGRFGGVSE